MAPVNLVSVNTAPERAQKVIGTVIQNVKDKYDIVHAGNSTTIEGVRPLLESVQPPPGILFCASMVSYPPSLPGSSQVTTIRHSHGEMTHCSESWRMETPRTAR